MTVPALKYFNHAETWIFKLCKLLSKLRPSKFCGFYTLRQGALIIATIELILTNFLLFILFMIGEHIHEVFTMTAYDLDELESSRYTLNVKSNFEVNEKRLIHGQELGLALMFITCLGTLIATIHFFCCGLLLYGTMKNTARFTLPWISSVFVGLVSGSIFFVVSPLVFKQCGVLASFSGLSVFGLELYSWLIVLSYYYELKT